MKIVIRAGGVGTRLWPVSRQNKPKQLHALLSDKTMLQEAIELSLRVSKAENIYVSGNRNYEDVLRQDLGAVLENNLIIEPARRETAAAIGLESVFICKKDPRAVVASLGSDHSIQNKKEFIRLLGLAEKAIIKHPHNIICLSIKPTYPDTGYGYIELGRKIEKEFFLVTGFHEKPQEKLAKKYVKAGNYLWNANMFVWRVDTILKLYEKFLPKMYKQLMRIKQDIGTEREKETIEKYYPKLKKIAIDYAIIEKAKNIIALPANIGWCDIGDWARLKDELCESEEGNVIKADYLGIDTKNSLIYSETKKLIATISLENIVIVETDDALLVCDKYRAQDVKKIVEELKKKKRNKYL